MVSAAVGSPAAKTGKVGEFVVQLAAAMGQDAKSVSSASRSLERMGVKLSVDAETPLTEGLVARIATDLGIGIVPPANQNAPVTAPRASTLASLMGTSVTERTSAVSIEPPTECLQSENRGECVECCKAVIGELPNPSGEMRDAGRECAEFCTNNVPRPPSDSEPQP
jgi:hypothetical protein